MFGFGKKIGMTRIFVDNKIVAVTAVEFAEQNLLQKKTKEKDGYEAYQIGFGNKSKTQTTKAKTGHIAKNSKLKNFNPEKIGEFIIPEDKVKDSYNIEDFENGDIIDLTSTTMGKGFTGVVKRYNFGGQPASHGHEHKKARGSIGSMYPQRVLPGTKMSGRQGTKTLTLKKAKVLEVDKENQILFIKGSIPGTNGVVVKISKY